MFSFIKINLPEKFFHRSNDYLVRKVFWQVYYALSKTEHGKALYQVVRYFYHRQLSDIFDLCFCNPSLRISFLEEEVQSFQKVICVLLIALCDAALDCFLCICYCHTPGKLKYLCEHSFDFKI